VKEINCCRQTVEISGFYVTSSVDLKTAKKKSPKTEDKSNLHKREKN